MKSKRQMGNEALQNALFAVQIEGLSAAFRRATKMLDDDATPASAHAAIISAMFRAGGLFAPATATAIEKQPHEMSPDELAAAISKALEEIAAEAPKDIFG